MGVGRADDPCSGRCHRFDQFIQHAPLFTSALHTGLPGPCGIPSGAIADLFRFSARIVARSFQDGSDLFGMIKRDCQP